MNKILKSILFTGFFLIGGTAACTIYVVPSPTAVVSPTASPIATQTLTPTEPVPTITSTPEFAPFCEPGTSSASTLPQCRVPAAEESSTFCKLKDPYNLILIDEGMTYEVLTEGFKCTDAGKKDGKQMITCTGQYAADFAVNVCDPACVVPTVQAAVTKCPVGYNYNSYQGCCTQEIQQINPSCTAFNFKTTSCVVRCFEFKKEAKCKRNSWACEWNDKDKICELRK